MTADKPGRHVQPQDEDRKVVRAPLSPDAGSVRTQRKDGPADKAPDQDTKKPIGDPPSQEPAVEDLPQGKDAEQEAARARDD